MMSRSYIAGLRDPIGTRGGGGRFRCAMLRWRERKGGFLLDQRTGEIWQRICDQKGAMVAFQRVKRLDQNGNLEKDEATKPQ